MSAALMTKPERPLGPVQPTSDTRAMSVAQQSAEQSADCASGSADWTIFHSFPLPTVTTGAMSTSRGAGGGVDTKALPVTSGSAVPESPKLERQGSRTESYMNAQSDGQTSQRSSKVLTVHSPTFEPNDEELKLREQREMYGKTDKGMTSPESAGSPDGVVAATKPLLPPEPSRAPGAVFCDGAYYGGHVTELPFPTASMGGATDSVKQLVGAALNEVIRASHERRADGRTRQAVLQLHSRKLLTASVAASEKASLRRSSTRRTGGLQELFTVDVACDLLHYQFNVPVGAGLRQRLCLVMLLRDHDTGAIAGHSFYLKDPEPAAMLRDSIRAAQNAEATSAFRHSVRRQPDKWKRQSVA